MSYSGVASSEPFKAKTQNRCPVSLAEVYKAMDQQRALFVAIKQVSLGGLHSGDISQIEASLDEIICVCA